MRRLMMGLVLAGGILAMSAGESQAQFSISIGNPYYGQGVAIGSPVYPYAYSNFARPAYPGYYGGAIARPVYPGYYGGSNAFSTSAYVAGPGVFSYSSGYRGYARPVVSYPVQGNPYGYVNRPYYGNFGYGNYSNGSRDGFRPFRGVNSWLTR
jgi:hypothetical protein